MLQTPMHDVGTFVLVSASICYQTQPTAGRTQTKHQAKSNRYIRIVHTVCLSVRLSVCLSVNSYIQSHHLFARTALHCTVCMYVNNAK